MIRVNGRGAAYGEMWFDEDPHAKSRVDILVHRQRHAPIEGAHFTPFLSLVTDLSISESALRDSFGKETRYEIRRAESKDGFHVEFMTDPKSLLDDFRVFYDAFAKQRSLERSSRRWLIGAAKASQLVLASVAKDGEVLVRHAYVVSGRTVRLQYSASRGGGMWGRDRALVGRANRWLHWSDMLRFKQLGKERYDWGGLFGDQSVPANAGIDWFKKSFSGRQERTYDCIVPVTVKGHLYHVVRMAWRGRRHQLLVRSAGRVVDLLLDS